ncbi:MAG: FAD-binding oxidoreductase [Chloroflexi bacterium]|nr:FAD-binding oxidoreductase [Chloroflexota bacterium]
MADNTLNRAQEPLDDTIYDHKWGFQDTRFVAKPGHLTTVTGSRYLISGTEMPEFLPFVEEMLGIKINLNEVKPELSPKPVPPPIPNEAFMTAVRDSFPASQYTQDSRERLVHSHGQTTADEVYKVLYGTLERVADLVFYLENEADAQKIIQLAAVHNVCLVPYGGGTSVSCALQLPANEKRMIVVIDTRRMNKIEWVDKENCLACVQAGMTGKQLEEALAEMGYTSGHEPDSMELSTVGGWVATNASGMKKNKYGNIEQIVQNVSMVTPQGLIEQTVAMPRVAMGMQLQNLLFGSEGTLGLITKAVLKIHKLPEVKKYGSLVFRNFETGVKFLYELNQAGVLPASIRLLDNVQFRFGSALKPRPSTSEKIMGDIQKFFLLKVKGFDPHELVAATIVMEGTAAEVAYQEKVLYTIASKYGGIKGGSTNGQRGYMLTYAIAYIRDYLADFDIIGETYETTVPWSKVMAVCNAVAREVEIKHKEYGLPGKPYISPRITQLYHTGVCIYFTHGFSTKGVQHPDEVFSAIEKHLRQTIMDEGGSISHHHGVGKIRKDFLPQTISPSTAEILKEVKQAHDPHNIFGIANNVFAE